LNTFNGCTEEITGSIKRVEFYKAAPAGPGSILSVSYTIKIYYNGCKSESAHIVSMDEQDGARKIFQFVNAYNEQVDEQWHIKV